MVQATNLLGQEILLVADAVAREKGIEKEEVFSALEEAIQKIGRTKYGLENDIRSTIDRKTGEVHLAHYRTVVEAIEDEQNQVLLEDARQQQEDIELGECLIEELPPIAFGRVAAQSAKQIITNRVRGAEKLRQYREYKERVGEIISGTIRRAEFGTAVLDLGRAEGFMRRDDIIPRENLRPGDRVRAYIYEVRSDLNGPQIFLSRTHPQFMAQLFVQEVPEVYEGTVSIKAVARDPGSHAKIAVYAREHSIDPVGACVGLRGSRVQAVVNELQGEKIDVVLWQENPANFVIEALTPAHPARVVMDEAAKVMDVVVPDNELSVAIGRRGQNVKLASTLTGWHINIRTITQDEEERIQHTKSLSELFVQALDVDDMMAHLLVVEGFGSIEDVALTPFEDMQEIEGFDDEIVKILQTRARDYLVQEDSSLEEANRTLGIAQDLVEFNRLTPKMKNNLLKKGLKTLDDVADLAGDELVDVLRDQGLTLDQANDIIMAARAHWFQEDEA